VSAHTAFSADGYTARWQTWDTIDEETLTLRWENEGWTATSEVSRERVHYVVRLSSTWQVRQFLLFRDLDEPDLWLATDGHARWGEMNGAHRAELDGCRDIDLSCTPFTASIPIRRLPIEVGERTEVSVVAIDVETLSVRPVRHEYRRTARRRWERETPSTGEVIVFDVDEYGLILDQPERFRRR
jgi:uncharacterized protein